MVGGDVFNRWDYPDRVESCDGIIVPFFLGKYQVFFSIFLFLLFSKIRVIQEGYFDLVFESNFKSNFVLR